MEIKITDDNWTAEVLVSPQPVMLDFVHCIAKVTGKTEADALRGAQCVLDLFAKGRETYVRNKPESDTQTNFDTKETQHFGFVRFSFRLESGDWVYPSQLDRLGLVPAGLGGL